MKCVTPCWLRSNVVSSISAWQLGCRSWVVASYSSRWKHWFGTALRAGLKILHSYTKAGGFILHKGYLIFCSRLYLRFIPHPFRPSDSVHRHLLPHPNGLIAEQAEAVLFLQEEGRNYMARIEQRKAMKGKKGKKGSLDRNLFVVGKKDLCNQRW